MLYYNIVFLKKFQSIDLQPNFISQFCRKIDNILARHCYDALFM